SRSAFLAWVGLSKSSGDSSDTAQPRSFRNLLSALGISGTLDIRVRRHSIGSRSDDGLWPDAPRAFLEKSSRLLRHDFHKPPAQHENPRPSLRYARRMVREDQRHLRR